MKKYLAIDLGASSGRGILGKIENGKLTLDEVHRFSNDPVETESGFFWDTLRLLFEIKAAILKCSLGEGVDTIGIDTWGVDYAYIDSTGAMMAPSYQYRDSRTTPMMDEVYAKVPYSELYKVTGVESMSFNTIFQIADDLKRRPWLCENADKLLPVKVAVNFTVDGHHGCEAAAAETCNDLDRKSAFGICFAVLDPQFSFQPLLDLRRTFDMTGGSVADTDLESAGFDPFELCIKCKNAFDFSGSHSEICGNGFDRLI